MICQYVINLNLFASLKAHYVFTKHFCNYSAQVTHSSSISTAILLPDFCMEIPSRVTTAPCWPQHNTLTVTTARSCKDREQDPREGSCLFRLILALLEATKDLLSLHSLGTASQRQRVCCHLLSQIALMKDIAALEAPQENVVNLWLSLQGYWLRTGLNVNFFETFCSLLQNT